MFLNLALELALEHFDGPGGFWTPQIALYRVRIGTRRPVDDLNELGVQRGAPALLIYDVTPSPA